MSEKPKRKWVYCQPPKTYEMAPCSCGNYETQWSEFQGHLWCEKCQKDFIPEHSGMFDGPVLIEACELMGVYFDRLNLETGEIEPAFEGHPVHLKNRTDDFSCGRGADP